MTAMTPQCSAGEREATLAQGIGLSSLMRGCHARLRLRRSRRSWLWRGRSTATGGPPCPYSHPTRTGAGAGPMTARPRRGSKAPEDGLPLAGPARQVTASRAAATAGSRSGRSSGCVRELWRTFLCTLTGRGGSSERRPSWMPPSLPPREDWGRADQEGRGNEGILVVRRQGLLLESAQRNELKLCKRPRGRCRWPKGLGPAQDEALGAGR